MIGPLGMPDKLLTCHGTLDAWPHHVNASLFMIDYPSYRDVLAPIEITLP
jgi:hypothetical protein